MEKISKTEQEWRDQLTPEEFHITREAGTERPFTGEYVHNKQKGAYKCVCCDVSLFESETKFDSGSGWPSFWSPAVEENVDTHSDRSLLMVRTEVVCASCDAHLGHVFNDGPQPTGLRFCINSAALEFSPEE